jgi:S-adenosylmethionine-dependent methyltransferase
MSDIVRDYYDRSVEVEWSRMDRHPLEFELTKRHIDALLGPGRGREILDLGGGPGRYAFRYAALGHAVSLVDLSPGNVAFALAKQAELGLRLRECRTGDARSLPFLGDRSFDLVLCLGPLYHLVEEADRSRAVAECARLTRPGGHLVFGFVTKNAQALSLLKRDLRGIAAWEAQLRESAASGRNDPGFDSGFTEAFFVDPIEIEGIVAHPELELLRVVGAEGLGCQSEERLQALDPESFGRWLDFFFERSADPSSLGANQHVLALARKRAI